VSTSVHNANDEANSLINGLQRQVRRVNIVANSPDTVSRDDDNNRSVGHNAGLVSDTTWGPYSVIVCDLIEGCGLIRQQSLQELRMALQFMTNANRADTSDQDRRHGQRSGVPRGLTPVVVVPYRVTVVVALVECHHLLHHHWVDPENTVGVSVGYVFFGFWVLLSHAATDL
jgi:hypothetical protein